jgi:integrase
VITLSNKLDKSLEKIEKVFEKMKNKGISVGGGRVSDRTIQTYTDMMKSLLREANKRFGVADIKKVEKEQIDEIVQDRINKYHSGDTSQSYNLKTLAAAIKSFNFGVENTRVFKGNQKFEVADPEEIRQKMKDQFVIRKSKASKVLRGTPDECRQVLENIKKTGYDTKTREIAYHVSKISFETGGRISAILRLKTGDFKVDEKKSTITYQGDKGGLTRTVEISKDTAAYLQFLSAGKKPNERLFSSVRQEDGTFLSVEETRKEISRVISEAGKPLARTEMVKMKDAAGNDVMVPVEKKVSSHFFRKGFSLDRTQEYYNRFSSKSAIDKFIAEKIAENPKVKDKLDVVRDRINKDRKKPRDLTRQEYAIFATSMDLGHFRNDVISAFYTTFQEVERYFKGK